MALFLPGSSFQIPSICALCDKPSAFNAILRIRAYDPLTNKLIATEIDLEVCAEHAGKMDVQIDKTLKPLKKIQLII